MVFYDVKTQFEDEDDKGKIKKVKERYILQAVSPTDAEAIAHERYGDGVIGFEVLSVTKTNITDIFKKHNI